MRNGAGYGDVTEQNAIFTSCLCIYKGRRCAEVNNAQVRVQLEWADGGNISSTRIFLRFYNYAFVHGNINRRSKYSKTVEGMH